MNRNGEPNMIYDLIVIGGGPGGYLAAERAGEAGLQTLLIEKAHVGGVCLNEGCIPSKTFLNSAKIYEHARHGEAYGVKAETVTYDQAAVVRRKNKIVRNLVAGVQSQLKKNKVDLVNGAGRIAGREAGKFRVQVEEESFLADKLIIAAGSEAIVPPIPGIKEGMAQGTVVTNREILDLQEIPERLTVIGGGVIGLEMAAYFQTCGSQVRVIEMLDHIGGAADLEIAALMQKTLSKAGIEFYLNSRVTSVGQGEITYEDANGSQTVATDLTLLSVGRKPVVRDYGLETIGVYIDQGRIVTDEKGLTNVPGVYAVGDVNGRWMLAHAAYREAEVAVNTILGKADKMRYAAMPSVIYTNPEMAFVGETEETCKEKALKYRSVKLPMNYSGRYMAENEAGKGIIKLLIDNQHERILGCHLLGGYAAEIIIAAGMMIENELRLDDIKQLIFPHPTVAEIIREAVFHA